LEIARSKGIETPSYEKWTKAKFKAQLSTVFTEEILAKFGSRDYTSIDAWEYSEGITYMVTYSCYVTEEGIVFSFKQFGESWKLYQISYQKD
jgi:hypothetical protein